MSTYDKEAAKENLEKAIEIAGGCKAVAKALGITEQGVFHYKNRGVKANQVVQICELTGFAIRPEELRPDVFTGVDKLPGALERMSQVETAGKDGYEVKDEMMAVAAAYY